MPDDEMIQEVRSAAARLTKAEDTLGDAKQQSARLVKVGELIAAVNHPAHYAEGRKHEPIDVIEDWQLGFCLGNTLKYISRAGRKGDRLSDLRKAAWYLAREIEQEARP